MKSSVETINSVQRRINIELPADTVNKAFDKAYDKIRRNAKIQGFRPGKAPLNMIKKLYGATVTGEVVEALIQGNLFGALEEKQVRPIAQPMIEAKEAPVADKAFAFSAVVDVMPEISLSGAYKGLRATCDLFRVTDESIAREIEALRSRFAKTKSAPEGAKAKDGFVATIAHSAKRDGTVLPQFDVKNMPVMLGRGQVFKDIEDGIMGMAQGETKEIRFTLPPDFADKDLAGATLDFSITVNLLQELELPAVDNEFAKDMEFESLDKLKEDIRKNLESQAKDLRKRKLEAQLLDQLREKSPFDVPPSMVDNVVDSMIEEMKFNNDGEKKQALANDEFRKNFHPEAKKRTQNTLLLWQVIKDEKIEVADEDVRTYLKEAFRVGAEGEGDAGQVEQLIGRVGPKIKERLMFDRALDVVINSAKITDTPKDL